MVYLTLTFQENTPVFLVSLNEYQLIASPKGKRKIKKKDLKHIQNKLKICTLFLKI